jgi:uncharacterized protein (DUF2237 family)
VSAASAAPGQAAARARLAAVQPEAYARSRNHLDGAVTGLSPYLTHGLLSLPQVLAEVLTHHDLPVQHKLVFELGWRAYFRHVWAHRGAGIFASVHPGPLPDAAYARELPADIRAASTGVPVIDQAVHTLYATGTLHNHARMWLASYAVHLRKVHWRAGADWLYGHLLDGDLASNHLSWQWVAGTASRQPYLFNAENVARHAPPPWHRPSRRRRCLRHRLAAATPFPSGGRAPSAAWTAPPACCKTPERHRAPVLTKLDALPAEPETMNAKNVLGSPLVPCSYDPLTGYFRDGCCHTDAQDAGSHVICARVTQAFLEFSTRRGNDLVTPRPEYRFRGLRDGDRWCLCALRWKEALAAGVAPPVVLESTHERALDYVSLEQLRAHEYLRSRSST